jgi:hypothetical protein
MMSRKPCQIVGINAVHSTSTGGMKNVESANWQGDIVQKDIIRIRTTYKKAIICEIVVLIPCYNEGKTIGKVISDCMSVLPETDFFVYGNNSSDNTALNYFYNRVAFPGISCIAQRKLLQRMMNAPIS